MEESTGEGVGLSCAAQTWRGDELSARRNMYIYTYVIPPKSPAIIVAIRIKSKSNPGILQRSASVGVVEDCFSDSCTTGGQEEDRASRFLFIQGKVSGHMMRK